MTLSPAAASFRRRGSTLPMVAVLMISLFGFVALAVDIGMLAVARTNCQNAADVAALAGCRTLNNRPGVADNNRALALTTASSAVTSNTLLTQNFTSAQVQSVTAGVYAYDPSSQTFSPSFPSSPPAGQSWTAMRVAVNVNQPTYFARIFGFNSLPMSATATAVYRPRDVAFVLDMTGSMAYATSFNAGQYSGAGRSLNPDDLFPSFGHYGNVASSLQATANLSTSDGEAISRNNYTIATPGGPPVVRNFYFDPVNLSNPTTSATPVTLVPDPNDPTQMRPQCNAFHRSNVTESGGDSTSYTPPVYDFSQYNPNANSVTEGATPAPDWYGDQVDNGTQKYAGDRWRRVDGKIYKTSTSWSSNSTRMAGNAAELLGYTVTGSGSTKSIKYGNTSVSGNQFWDPVWEQYGYDLDIAAYRSWRASSNSNKPGKGGSFSTLLPTADRFQGYSMGPGYWGKTFFIWPPDPRPANDWRKKFFTNWTGNSTSTNINSTLLQTSTNNHVLKSGNYTPDYSAILAWIKSGPQVLPPNLRAGRVVYYTSIPDDVNTSSGSSDQKLDKAFWREYIDWVLANGYASSTFLYGYGDSWSSAPLSVNSGSMSTWTGPDGNWKSTDTSPAQSLYPYLSYSDSPNRPRLHFWFGPLSMLDFIGRAANSGDNWKPGTCYEAQCWQLKAAMNSVIDDVRINHPNDTAGMVMFSYPNYNDIRVPMGQNYTALKNALFYPNSLLTAINGGDTTSEYRPYTNTSLGGYVNSEIPNADGGTDPGTGLALAFNLLSPSANLGSQYGTVKGRRGAAKMVIFETDGVPNSYRSLTLNKRGYNTYYTVGGGSGSPGNGNSTVMNQAIGIATQMSKPMATTTTNNVDSGLSLPNAPCRVYSIAFGDLFDPVASPSATFRGTALQFLANVQIQGGTSPAGSTTIPSNQQITGPYQTRIDTMKTCLQQIFGSGVTVSLIE